MGFTIWDEYDAPEFSLLVHFWKVFVLRIRRQGSIFVKKNSFPIKKVDPCA